MPTHRSLAGRLAATAVCVLLVACRSHDAGSMPRSRRTFDQGVAGRVAVGRAGRRREPAASADSSAELVEYPVTAGSHPHDVAPAVDGGVWYTGQHNGTLGHLDPQTGEVREIDLGAGSAPHGVIVGPDGAPWITDGGLNAIVRVDPATEEVEVFELPASHPDANLNTAAFDGDGVLWFTGQSGMYGRLDPEEGQVEAFDAPRGRGPYGITATPSGDVWYASLAGSHIARIDRETGEATVVEPPTAGQGARRIWSDSNDRLWVAEWNAGQVGVHDPWTAPGRSGRSPATGLRPTPSTSMTATACG